MGSRVVAALLALDLGAGPLLIGVLIAAVPTSTGNETPRIVPRKRRPK